MYTVGVRKIKKTIKKIFKFFGIYLSKEPVKFYYEVENSVLNGLIQSSNGVLHIGAHFGQEAKDYNDFNKKVIWIEAIPEVHQVLLQNISRFENQRAICALLGDTEKQSVEMYLSNNDFSASSIFDLHPKSGFKNVHIENKISLDMNTLDKVLQENECEVFSHWILDVQGAELLVLKGSSQSLLNCHSLVVEISSRPTYNGGVEYDELRDYLAIQGFLPLWEPLKNDHTNIPFLKVRK